jgi:hypothetical protein
MKTVSCLVEATPVAARSRAKVRRDAARRSCRRSLSAGVCALFG